MGEEQYFNALVTNLNKGLLFFSTGRKRVLCIALR